MSSNENLELTTKAWAEIVIKIWEDKIIKKNIRQSGELLNSFVSNVYCNANGNPERILFAFNFYGIFADLGVGNGVKADELDSLRSAGLTKRKKNSWFSGTFDFQVEKLADILAEKYGIKIASSITNALDK
jgi:hypothetical protein